MEDLMLSTPVQPPPLLAVDTVCQQLRSDIVNGVFEPGQVLRQVELAKQYQVSRVPLREALNRLVAEGLVVSRPQRGYCIVSLEPDAIVEVFELRMVIEEHAGAIAARSRSPEDVARARVAVDKMESLDPNLDNYLAIWSGYNNDFHTCLINSTRRSRLGLISNSLRASVEPYIRIEARMTGEVFDAEREHREMFEAFRAGDARGLAELSRTHVENTARRLLVAIRRRNLDASKQPANKPRTSGGYADV